MRCLSKRMDGNCSKIGINFSEKTRNIEKWVVEF